METENTFSLFRDVLREPTLFDRSPWTSDAAETAKAAQLLDKAQTQYDQAKQYAPEFTASADICREVDKIVQRATKHILD